MSDSLKALAAEYLENAAVMEARIQQLENQAETTRQLEVRRKLRVRINTLSVMVCESRQTAFQLEHYYDTPEEKAHATTSKPKKRGRPRKPKRERFRRSGYGNPTPAAVERSGDADAKAVSGIYTAFLGRNSAERYRG